MALPTKMHVIIHQEMRIVATTGNPSSKRCVVSQQSSWSDDSVLKIKETLLQGWCLHGYSDKLDFKFHKDRNLF